MGSAGVRISHPLSMFIVQQHLEAAAPLHSDRVLFLFKMVCQCILQIPSTDTVPAWKWHFWQLYLLLVGIPQLCLKDLSMKEESFKICFSCPLLCRGSLSVLLCTSA